MSNEIAAYVESLEGRFALLRAHVESMTAKQLNARPAFDGANSVWVLAMHICGNARAWIIGIVAGQPIGRDRASEFVSHGDDPAALLAHIDRTRADVIAALQSLPPERLDVRLLPPGELWGEGAPREISVRDGVLHVIEHMSLHLGHIDVTRAVLAH